MSRGLRAGVDIGGTFTDVVTVVDGRMETHKTPSTPDEPATAVGTGLDAALKARGREHDALEVLAHGTTIATNAVLEEAWAETALVTTEGFRDVLEIGRQARPDIYDFDASKPPAVVPRHRRHEVGERIDEGGSVVESLDQGTVERVVSALEDEVEAVAVSLLYAFEDDTHEREVASAIAEEHDVAVSCSSAVLPEIREYERTLATALNAGLQPVIEAYLGELAGDLDARSPAADLRVMGSNGGTMSAATARDRPVRTLLSGPAAGVRGAAHVGAAAGYDDLLTMDMGGTSCDVSLVRDGEPTVSTDVEVGDYPIALPMVDVHTVGSGGGSVAWIDDGGALRVGPRSAGADPGPVCYGRGGRRPTTTDAQVLLGRLDPTAFLDAPADRATVESVMADSIAEPMDRTVEDAAAGVLEVANATMERALRVVSVERGHDPRDLTLVAFGGAGPLHAPALAEALDVPRVVIPRAAGVLSALGLLVSDLVRDFSRSMIRSIDGLDPTDVETAMNELAAAGQDALEDAGIPPGRRTLERSVDLRYAGQSFDLRVPIDEACDGTAIEEAVERFHHRHRERYGHADPGQPVELATVRLRARGVVEPPTISPPERTGAVTDAIRGERMVYVDGTAIETPVYDRDALPVDGQVGGPAIVEGGQSTAFVRPGQRAFIDDLGSLVVEVHP